jgi:hypothetical protein
MKRRVRTYRRNDGTNADQGGKHSRNIQPTSPVWIGMIPATASPICRPMPEPLPRRYGVDPNDQTRSCLEGRLPWMAMLMRNATRDLGPSERTRLKESGPLNLDLCKRSCTSHKLGPGKCDVDLSRKAWKRSLFVGRRCAFKQSDDFEEALFNFGRRCEC